MIETLSKDFGNSAKASTGSSPPTPASFIRGRGFFYVHSYLCIQVNNPVNITLAALIGFIAIGVPALRSQVHRLDAATAAQCATHDWPAEKHAEHMDFCHTYGYITK